MRQLWHHWILDNPFLLWEVRRRLRRGYPWKVVLGCVAVPVLILLLFQGLATWGPSWGREAFQGRYGLFLFTTLTWVHLVLANVFWSGSMTLNAEAAADRLDFLRLIPRGRREFLVLMGLARMVIRLLPLFLPLPVYVLLLSFGKLRAEDVLGLYVVLGLALFAPPNTIEITAARGFRHGVEATDKRQATASGAMGGLAWPLMLQVLIHLVIRPVIFPLFRLLTSGWGAAVGPDLGAWMPFSLLAAVARIVGSPQPFFHASLAPFLPLLLFGLLAMVVRVIGGAELWSRETLLVPQGGGRMQAVLTPETGRPEERKLGERLTGFNALFAAMMTTGFLWPVIMRGGLGKLIGQLTPEGSLVSLALLFGCGCALFAWERVARSGSLVLLGPAGALRAEMMEWGRTALIGALFFVAAALIGGIRPGSRSLDAVLRLLAAGSVATLFGLGWQAFARRYMLPHGTEEAAIAQANGWRVLGTLLWVAAYAAPLAALTLGKGWIGWHYLSGWSPVYAVLALLPGVWATRAPLPLPAQLLLPAAAGVVLWLSGPRTVAAKVEARPRRRDRLERWLEPRLQALDNPFTNLSLRRLERKPTGLGGQVGVSLGLYVVGSLVLAIAMLNGLSARSGVSILAVLERPTGFLGLTLGAAGALGGAGLGLGALLQFWPMALAGQVQMEHTLARTQGRIPFLYLSGLEDETLVRGVMMAGLLATAPFLAGFSVTSALWLTAALILGAHPGWALFWFLGLAAVAAQGMHLGLAGFEIWRLERKFWEKFLVGLRQLVTFIGWLALIPVVIILVLIGKVTSEQVLLGYGALLLVISLYSSFRLRTAYRKAILAVHASRHEADLERVS